MTPQTFETYLKLVIPYADFDCAFTNEATLEGKWNALLKTVPSSRRTEVAMVLETLVRATKVAVDAGVKGVEAEVVRVVLPALVHLGRVTEDADFLAFVTSLRSMRSAVRREERASLDHFLTGLWKEHGETIAEQVTIAAAKMEATGIRVEQEAAKQQRSFKNSEQEMIVMRSDPSGKMIRV